MNKIKKQIVLQELTLKGMMSIKGGDHSHDIISDSGVPTENYGSGGPPPLRDNGSGEGSGGETS